MSAVSPAVSNGPSGPAEQNGMGEQVWERPWSLDEIRRSSANWSLAADSGLFLFLQDFSQRMLSKTHEIEKQLDGLIRDTKATDCCLHTVFNDFLMLSNTQFIENRVYDDEVEEPVSKPEAPEIQPEQEKTREQKEAELIPKVQEAVTYGLRVLESAFEQLDMKAGNSDSEDEETTDRVEPILEPKDLYVDRPLPHLIGSQHFMEQDDVGLGDLSSEEMSLDSDRDSVIDSEEDKNDDQSDDFDQDEEGQGSMKKTLSMASEEDEEEEDEEEDSDIFGESDKDENEDGKSSMGPASFADELAARITGDVPSRPDEDRSSLKSSAAKKKSRGKKEPKAAKAQAAPDDDDDDMFGPPKMEDEDFSPFGGRGGLFSGGRGLFDDDDEGDLFSDVPKPQPGETSRVPPAEDPVPAKSNKKTPTGAVSAFPGSSLFGPGANDSDSPGTRENGGPPKPQAFPAPVASSSGLFDDDDEDFFSGGGPLRKSASAGFEKPKQKRSLDLFGGDGDGDDEDEDRDIFGMSSGAPPPKPSPKENTPPTPEKKMLAGAVSMFGPGTKDVLVEGLKRRQPSSSEEAEKPEEAVSGPEVPKLLPKPVVAKPSPKPQSGGLFSDDEDAQIFPSVAKSPVVQSKAAKTPLSIFDDEEEEDLFLSTPAESKSNEGNGVSAQKPSQPGSIVLFSSNEDQWMSSKLSQAKPGVKTGMRGSNSAPSSLPSATAAPKDSLFDEDDGDHDLFSATEETRKKSSQRVSLLFEEEEDDEEEGRNSLFGFQPPAGSSTPDVKVLAPDSGPPSHPGKQGEEGERGLSAESSQRGSEEPKEKQSGAAGLFGERGEDTAKPAKRVLDEPDEDDFLYKDSPPPMEEEPRAKKNIVSLFDDDDEDDEEEEETASTPSQPTSKNMVKAQEPRSRTKSTRVFQDEELLFTQKLQKDNDPDVDLFSTSVKPAGRPPAGPTLFGDDEEDDLFSSAKPKAAPKVAEKPKREEAPPAQRATAPTPVSADAQKPTSSVKSKEPSSRIGKLQANLAIRPASLLPGAVPRLPGAVSVFPGPSPLSPLSPSPLSPSSSSSSSSSVPVPGQPPSPTFAAVTQPDVGVSFDGPAQVSTLQSANKGRPRGAGRRRPQTRAARQLAAQLSDELREDGPEEGGAGRAGSGVATPPSSPPAASSRAPPNTSIPTAASGEVAKPRMPADCAPSPATATPSPAASAPVPTAPPAADDHLFESDDLFAPVGKQTPSPKPAGTEWPAGRSLKKEAVLKRELVPAMFDDPGGDLFQAARLKPAKKPKAAAAPFLDEEDDDIFGAVGRSSTATVTKDPPPESNPSKQDIFQEEKQEAPKKRKGKKEMDASLFDDNVDIFADLTTTTTKPKEKKAKKKVETKSIFDDDMDDIFSSGTVKPVAKPQTETKKTRPAKDSDAAGDANRGIFDDPLNALGK